VAKLLIGSKKVAQTSSITMPSMVVIVGRAAAVDQKVLCFFVTLSKDGSL